MSVAIKSKGYPQGEGKTLVAMVLYDGVTSRSRAGRIYHELHRRLGEEIDFEVSWWKFEYFSDQEMVKAATEVVAMADVVLVAMGGGGELPSLVKSWILRWPPHPGERDRSLLGFLEIAGIGDRSGSGAREFLEQVATERGMDFLPYREQVRTAEAPPVQRDSAKENRPSNTEWRRGWGLNE